MSPLIILEQSLDRLTKKEAAIAKYVLEDINRIVDENPADIVKNANSSKSAFIRMCKKINFAGYVDFRYACIAHINQHKYEKMNYGTDYTQEIANKYIKKTEEFLTKLDREKLELVSQLILQSDKIRSFGHNSSLLACQQLQMRALTAGLEIIPSSNRLAFLKMLTILKNNDLLLYFAVNVGSPPHQEIMNFVKHASCKKVLITMVDLPSETQFFDYSIVLPSVPISAHNFYLDNQTIFFIFIDILVQTVI